MPFTAVHAGRGLLDTSILTPDIWAEVHQRGAPLACPRCRERMVAVESVRGLPYFRHHRRLDCAHGEGETETHRAIKRAVLAAVRAVDGWTAEPEVTGEGTRADVLATGPDGRRVAFEAQVSSIGGVTAVERARRHEAVGTEVVWLPTTPRHALADLPRAQIALGEEWVVVEHALKFVILDLDFGMWCSVALPLAAFIGAICRGSVRWVTLDGRAFWTTQKHVQQWQKAKRMKRMGEPRLVYPNGTINGRPRAPFTPAAGRTPARDWEREATVQAQALCKQRWRPSGGPTPW